MAGAIHGILTAMDNLANAPVVLTARLLQPAPPRPHKQSAADLTPPKVVRRKRRLTLPLGGTKPEPSGKMKWFGKAVQQRTLEQLQSPLLRLPAELRELIWRNVILGRGEVLSRDEGAIEMQWRSTSAGRGRASAFKVPQLRQSDDRGLGVMGMLCSCRIVYSETINLLYSLPTFAFRHQNFETFLAFVCAIPPARVDQIRYLDLRWLGMQRTRDQSEGPQKPEHQSNIRWSYLRISNIKALSQLPDATIVQAEQGLVHSDWVINEILKSMKGLEKGGVNWGSASIGCFAREGASLEESMR